MLCRAVRYVLAAGVFLVAGGMGLTAGETRNLTIDQAAAMALANNDKIRQFEERLAQRHFDRGVPSEPFSRLSACPAVIRTWTTP